MTTQDINLLKEMSTDMQIICSYIKLADDSPKILEAACELHSNLVKLALKYEAAQQTQIMSEAAQVGIDTENPIRY